MGNNDTKANLNHQHREKADKHSLLLRLSIYMAWMGIISLLISLVAYTQLNSKSSATGTDNSAVREDG